MELTELRPLIVPSYIPLNTSDKPDKRKSDKICRINVQEILPHINNEITLVPVLFYLLSEVSFI